jgi:hypothetical protein
MHKSATKCNETLSKWCKNKHGASKIIDTFETYHLVCGSCVSSLCFLWTCLACCYVGWVLSSLSLSQSRTWVLVPWPPGVNIVGCLRPSIGQMNLLRNTRHSLLPRALRSSLEFIMVILSVPSWSLLPYVHLVLSIVVFRGWTPRQIDVSNAFLHGFLSEDNSCLVLRMHNIPLMCASCSMLFMDLSSRCVPSMLVWVLVFMSLVLCPPRQIRPYSSSIAMVFPSSCLFMCMILLSLVLYLQCLSSLFSHSPSPFLRNKDLGRLEYFLGWEASYNSTGMQLTQRKYAFHILHCVNMDNC